MKITIVYLMHGIVLADKKKEYLYHQCMSVAQCEDHLGRKYLRCRKEMLVARKSESGHGLASLLDLQVFL